MIYRNNKVIFDCSKNAYRKPVCAILLMLLTVTLFSCQDSVIDVGQGGASEKNEDKNTEPSEFTYLDAIDFAGQTLPLYFERGFESLQYEGDELRLQQQHWHDLFYYKYDSACHKSDAYYEGKTIDHVITGINIAGDTTRLRKTLLGEGSWGPNANSGKPYNGCNVREIRMTLSAQPTPVMCAVTRVKWSPVGAFEPIPIAERNTRRIGGKVGFSVANYLNNVDGEITNHPGACQGPLNENSGSYFATMFRDTIRKDKVPDLSEDQFTLDGFYIAAYSMHKNRSTPCAEDLFVKEPSGDFFVWLPDTWVEIELCVANNTFDNGVANADGQLRMRVNRTNVATKEGLIISNVSPYLSHAGFDDLFAGGDSSAWAFKQDVYWYYDTLKVYTTSGNIYPYGPISK